MENSETTLPRIAIIGAGVCGLLLAHGLQKNGFPVTVYEKENYIGERLLEWTMLVHWALPTFQKMLPDYILKDIAAAHSDPSYPYDKETESIPFYNGATGDIAFRVTGAVRRVSRTRLRRVCAKGLDIHWGKQMADLQLGETGPVTISFHDGGTATADLVIGTDGSNSKVRQWLVGEPASRSLPSEYVIANGIVKYETAEQALTLRAVHPVCALSVLPGGVAFVGPQDVEDPQDPATYSFHVARVWKGKEDYCNGAEAIAKLKATLSDGVHINEPFRSAIEWIPDSATFTISQLQYWVTVPWDNKGGRVTLAGDAAHCLLPNRGQGLNHALADVVGMITQFVRIKDEGISSKTP